MMEILRLLIEDRMFERRKQKLINQLVFEILCDYKTEKLQENQGTWHVSYLVGEMPTRKYND